MKLKFKKQTIASLHLMQQLKAGSIDGEIIAFTEPPSVEETQTVCNSSNQLPCTISLNPDDCHTNDGTLKTWDAGFQGESRYVYC